MIERLLRWIAVAIAVAAIVDPAVTLSGRARRRTALVVQTGPSMDLPSAIGTRSRRDVAREVIERLTRDLAPDFEFVEASDARLAAAVIVGDHYSGGSTPTQSSISTVSLSSSIAPNVRLVSLEAPVAVPAATAVRIQATIEAVGVRGVMTTAVVQSGGVEVGRSTHVWSADREMWHTGMDVVPVGTAPFSFVFSAEPLPAERTAIDNVGTVRVALAPPIRVLVFEARPSWALAFVRRSLEADARFHVSGIGRVSPKALVVSGDTRRLSETALASVDALIVGGLDAVATAEIDQIDRFMRERGGVVILLPDTSASVTVFRDPFGLPPMKETLLDRQAALAVPPRLTRMDASELLALVNPPDDVDVVAQMPGSAEPIVWTAPRGNGRLLFSGAMDAWRFRSADFDRFWQSAIAGLGLSARQAMSIEVSAGRASVQVRDEDAAVSGALLIAQNDGSVATQPIRLMPDAARGQFSGLLGVARVSPADRLVVTAERAGSKIEQITLAEPLVIGVPLEASGPPLGLLSATHRGVDVTPDHLDVLERFLRSTAAGSPSPIVRRPMRSAWWMFPFAGCLSAEWWLRRKRGAR